MSAGSLSFAAQGCTHGGMALLLYIAAFHVRQMSLWAADAMRDRLGRRLCACVATVATMLCAWIRVGEPR